MAARTSSALLILGALALFFLLFAFKAKDKMVDFEVNYWAAQRLRQGETLYRVEDGHYQFKYLPFAAFLYLPVSLLPLPAAKAVWFGVAAVSSVFIFILSAKLIATPGRNILAPAAVSALVLARYFFRELELGQINALLTLLLVFAIASLTRSGSAVAPVSAGACGGLAAALKPYALIFFPYFAVRTRWKPLVSALAVFCLALLAPALFYGWQGNLTVLREWKSSLAASTPPLFSSQDNISLMGFLTKWTGRQNLSLALYALILAALAALVLFLVRRGSGRPQAVVLESFLLLMLIPLISPLGWDYTLLAAAPAVMLIASHFSRFPGPGKILLAFDLLIIALSLYDLMGRPSYAAFMSWSVITVNFLVLVGFLVYLRVKGHA